MASQPAESPTPTCSGDKILRALCSIHRAAHLEVSRWKTSPTLIGRRPSFFCMARERHHKDMEQHLGGIPSTEKVDQLSEPQQRFAQEGEGQNTAPFR